MSLSSYALVSVADAKSYMNITNTSLTINAFTIYNSSSDATASTVQVSTTSLILVVTGGTNAGTSTLAFSNASYDTVSELVTSVNNLAKGWVANLSAACGNESSSDLTVIAATGCLLTANTQTLTMVNNYRLENLINQATDAVEKECARKFVSRTYTNERYDGTGEYYLYTENYPITTLSKVVIGTVGVFTINNTSSDATTCYVSVTSTGLFLDVNGGANASETTLLFASYTTLDTLKDAVNNYGKGWIATTSTGYEDYLSTELLETPYYYCKNSTVTLDIPYTPKSDFELYGEEGTIYCPYGFVKGNRNIIITYTAGYSSTTLPSALALACLKLVKHYYDQQNKDRNVKSESLGDYSYTISESIPDIPRDIKDLLFPFKRLAIL